MKTEEERHWQEFLEKIEEVKDTKLDGIKRYGASSYNNLGPRGIFVDIKVGHISYA